jgi:hypothetical protein
MLLRKQKLLQKKWSLFTAEDWQVEEVL